MTNRATIIEAGPLPDWVHANELLHMVLPDVEADQYVLVTRTRYDVRPLAELEPHVRAHMAEAEREPAAPPEVLVQFQIRTKWVLVVDDTPGREHVINPVRIATGEQRLPVVDGRIQPPPQAS